MKSRCLLFLVIAFASNGELKAQITNTSYCLLNRYSVIANTSGDQNFEPLIGISFLGTEDSLFSFAEGNVTEVFTTKNNLTTVKIQDGDDIIMISFLKNLQVLQGNYVKKGSFLGTLLKKDSLAYLWVMIYHSGILLKKDETYKYLNGICAL